MASRLELLKEEQRQKYAEMDPPEGKQTKQKEKTIQEVIEKVALWRKLSGLVGGKWFTWTWKLLPPR